MTMNISSDKLAQIIYESAMWKLGIISDRLEREIERLSREATVGHLLCQTSLRKRK